MRLPKGTRRDSAFAAFWLAIVAIYAVEGHVLLTIGAAVVATLYGFLAGLWMEQRKVDR